MSKPKIYPTAKIVSENIEMGENCFIGDFCFIACKKLVMERGSQINSHSCLTGRGSIYLGENVVLSYSTTLLTSSDQTTAKFMNDASPEEERNIKTGDIIIGKNVFLGVGVIVMPNVKIGKNSVIGSGVYLDHNIPENMIVIPEQKLFFKQRWQPKTLI